MIPKIIHYVWLGGGAKTPSVKRCIQVGIKLCLIMRKRVE